MPLNPSQILEIKSDLLSTVEERWNRALSFYQKRGHVLFISDRYRFWDQVGFTQQSLAKVLVENGIQVTWLDGMTWKNESPILSFHHPDLKVQPLRCYPGRRFRSLDTLSIKKQVKQIRSEISKTSLVWVQGSLDDRIAKNINVDIFSVFDDCESPDPQGELAKKAKIILSQNAFSHDRFREFQLEKALLSLPPVELSAELFKAPLPTRILPPHFPSKMMGYLGACFPQGFDFELFERFVRELPDWGFIICGRTDETGKKNLERLSQYPNFYYRSWMPRENLASMWLKLKCNLMLYKDCRDNRGAYPIKVLESLFFGVPSVATRVPKTSSLEGICPVESHPQKLIEAAQRVAHQPGQQSKSFERLFYEMHPKIHLSKIAERLADVSSESLE